MKRMLLFAALAAVAGCGALLSPGDEDDLPPRTDDAGDDAREEADATGAPEDARSEATTDASSDAPGDGGAPSRLVFVSVGKYIPVATGVAVADTLCAAEQAMAGRAGPVVAWLSTSTTPAISRLTSNGPWKLANGTTVFPDRAFLANGNYPLVGINRNADGGVVTATVGFDNRVWTGSDERGVATGSDCASWTSSGAGGSYGTLGVGGAVTWTRATDGEPCTAAYHVICFEP